MPDYIEDLNDWQVDNTLKPSYHMLKGLIKDEWSSKGNARTNSDGVVKNEGVKGKYVIKYKGEIAEFVVDDNIDSVKITF